VRDLLLDRPSQDFDLVVEGDAIQLARSLARSYGGRVTTHAQFGTAKWHLPTQLALPASENGKDGALQVLRIDIRAIDMISARTEFYTHPTALPTVERGSIKLDLHRRDFTINTLALRLDGSHYGELHDYWGGLDDLRHSIVRVLHSLSFVDDPTRMLRAVRFEQRFNFRIEPRTMQLLREAISLLDRVSGDRIRHELDHILVEPRASQMLARLNALNLLEAIHPALTWDNWLQSRLDVLKGKIPDADWSLDTKDVQQHLKRDLAYCLWLIRLPQEQAAAVCDRLRMSSELKRAILSAGKLWQDVPALADNKPSKVVERLEDVPPLARYAVYRATSDIRLRKLLQTYASIWQKVFPTINGHDLRARDLKPGPVYRHILNTLRNAWLDGEIKDARDEARMLDQLLEETKSGT
jgi:tRNA nucleotidyltransferase (CCA-adding enzyme)